jgi:hypothetical protein
VKYVFNEKFDKENLKGDEFSFNIFSDLIINDNVEIIDKDAPYKTNFSTKDNDNVAEFNKNEIRTACIDLENYK